MIVKDNDENNEPSKPISIQNYTKVNGKLKNNSVFTVENNKTKQEEINKENNKPISEKVKQSNILSKAISHNPILTAITKPIMILHNNVMLIKPAKITKVKVKPKCPCKDKHTGCARSPPQSKSKPPCPKNYDPDNPSCLCPKHAPKINDNEPDILQTIKK